MVRDAAGRAAPVGEDFRLPIHIVETSSPLAAVSRALLAAVAVLAAAVPLTGLAIAAAAEQSLVGAAIARPLASLQVVLGLGLWALILLVPAQRSLRSVWVRREVLIKDGFVEIAGRSLLGARTSRHRLAEYRGIAHHIRASLSGLSHEIVLVHANPSLTVTLFKGERVTQAMLDDARAALGLPEVPARSIYERSAGQQSGGNGAQEALARA